MRDENGALDSVGSYDLSCICMSGYQVDRGWQRLSFSIRLAAFRITTDRSTSLGMVDRMFAPQFPRGKPTGNMDGSDMVWALD